MNKFSNLYIYKDTEPKKNGIGTSPVSVGPPKDGFNGFSTNVNYFKFSYNKTIFFSCPTFLKYKIRMFLEKQLFN